MIVYNVCMQFWPEQFSSRAHTHAHTQKRNMPAHTHSAYLQNATCLHTYTVRTHTYAHTHIHTVRTCRNATCLHTHSAHTHTRTHSAYLQKRNMPAMSGCCQDGVGVAWALFIRQHTAHNGKQHTLELWMHMMAAVCNHCWKASCMDTLFSRQHTAHNGSQHVCWLLAVWVHNGSSLLLLLVRRLDTHCWTEGWLLHVRQHTAQNNKHQISLDTWFFWFITRVAFAEARPDEIKHVMMHDSDVSHWSFVLGRSMTCTRNWEKWRVW